LGKIGRRRIRRGSLEPHARQALRSACFGACSHFSGRLKISLTFWAKASVNSMVLTARAERDFINVDCLSHLLKTADVFKRFGVAIAP
jgi:hypothetical protein